MGKLQSGGGGGWEGGHRRAPPLLPSGIGRSAPVSMSDIWTLADACGANAL